MFAFHSYFIVMTNSNEIKKDWNVNRCKPQNMLFAGIINKPPDSTVLEYTGENFTYCVQNILVSISSYFFQPFYYIYDTIIEVFNEIEESINAIRSMISNIRTDIQTIVTEIMGRILNVVSPLQTMMIAVMDSFGKVQGILTAGLMTALGGYFTLQSLVGAILQFIIIILVTMATIIIALWLGLFTWPAAATMTLMFLAISIPLSIIIVFMTQVLHIHTSSIPSVPKKPSCFDENTRFQMKNGNFKKIKHLELNDELINGTKITALFQLNAKDEKMYYLQNVIVSGTHSVYYMGKWILVKDHPKTRLIPTYKKKYLYCVNTSNKRIELNNLLFIDWDEQYDINPMCNKIDYERCGFHKNTVVILKNREHIKIKNIKIGDMLMKDEIVYGIVKLKNKHCKTKTSCYYNLLTNKGTIPILNKKSFLSFLDYNCEFIQ